MSTSEVRSKYQVQKVFQVLEAYNYNYDSFLHQFPEVKPNDKVINLSASSQIQEILAPAHDNDDINNEDIKEYDERLGIYIKRVNLNTDLNSQNVREEKQPNLLYLYDCHLIGVLSTCEKGYLKLQQIKPCIPYHTSLLIAPSPPCYYYKSLVYISDWRHLPSIRNHTHPCLLEVLLKDIHLLQVYHLPLYKSLSFSFDSNQHVVLNKASQQRKYVFQFQRLSEKRFLKSSFAIQGIVSSKSLLNSNNNDRSFFIELTSKDSSHLAAITCIFKDSNTSWWPFILIGSYIHITHVRQVRIIGFKQIFLAALSNCNIIDLNYLTRVSTPPLSRTSTSTTTTTSLLPIQQQNRKKLIQTGNIINYEGIITSFEPFGNIILDDYIILHLGEFNHCLAGRIPYRSFRKGTKIKLTNLLLILRHLSPPKLFSTARTTIEIIYFADIYILTKLQKYDSYIRLSRRLSQTHLIIVEEFFNCFVKKFGQWFSSNAHCDTQDEWNCDESVESALLGNHENPGLIQYIIQLFDDNDDNKNNILNSYSQSKRVLLKEFLSCLLISNNRLNKWPSLPTISNIRFALYLLYEDRKMKNRQPKSKLDNHFVFSNKDIFCKLKMIERAQNSSFRNINSSSSNNNNSKVENEGDIAIIGLLQGISDGRGKLKLSDSTDYIDIKPFPCIQPSFIDAMICIRDFTAIIDIHHEENSENSLGEDEDEHEHEQSNNKSSIMLTLVCNEDDIIVVVDGPCIDMHHDKAGGSKNNNKQGVLPSINASRNTLDILTQNSINNYSQKQENNESFIVDCQLVCIFVQQIVRNVNQCILIGRLMATKQSNSKEEWIIVDNEHENEKQGLWKCEFHISGKSALSMCSCFIECKLFAISCTDLENVSNHKDFLNKKAYSDYKRNKKFKLKCHLDILLPWIENLGLGVYMRFKANKGFQSTLASYALSQEGQQFIYINQAIDQFKNEINEQVQKRIWNLYHWKSEEERKISKTVGLLGIIQNIETVTIENSNNTSFNIYKITIMDNILQLFTIKVCFYNCFQFIRGLYNGMEVCINNIERVPLQNRHEGFEFVANNETSITVIKCKHEDYNKKSRVIDGKDGCTCEKRYDLTFDKLTRELDVMFINEFMGISTKPAGIIQVHLARVEWLEIYLIDEKSECEDCGIMKDELLRNGDESSDEDNEEDRRCVMMNAVIQVDDGSRVGVIRCSGFKKCVQLIGATTGERKALRRLAAYTAKLGSKVQAELADGRDYFMNQFRGHKQAKQDSTVVWELLRVKRMVNCLVAVLNRAAVNERINGKFQQVVSQTYKLGSSGRFGGKSVMMVRPPLVNRVLLECVAVFIEARTVNRLRQEHVKETNDLSALVVLRNILK